MASERQLLKTLFAWLGNQTVVWQGTNLSTFIKDAYLKNSDFAAIVNYTSENAAKMPIIQEVLEGDDWVIEKESPYLELMRNPNPTQGAYEYATEVYSWFLITGNSYENAEAPKAGLNKGIPKEIWNMPADVTEIITGGWKNPVQEYKIRFSQNNTQHIDAERVIHMKRFNPDYQVGAWLYGLPKLVSASQALTSSNNAYQTKASQLLNGGIPGIMTGENDLSKEQKGLFSNILRKFSDTLNIGKIPFMSNKLEYIKVGSEMVDLRLLESILNDKRALCSVYGLSAGLFNDPEGSTYNNKVEEKKAAYTDVILPLVNHRLAEHSRFFLGLDKDGNSKLYSDGKQRRLRADTSGIEVLQKDFNAMASAIQKVSNYLTYGMVWDHLGVTPPETLEHLRDEIPMNIPSEINPMEEEIKKLGIQLGEYKSTEA